MLSQVAQGEPMWTTYHRDAARSGYDPDATQPIEPTSAWQTVDLGAPIWSQPLVLGERVYVATVGDEVYALEASTGNVMWKKSVGTPVPSEQGSSQLPCGDIEPTVGVVGTPVIDPSTETIYMVADTWDAAAKEAHHLLEGLRLSDGEELLSTNVDPPGADPKALLQRTALNLDNGNVIFGFGGNDGDCSDYRGAVVMAPLNGGTPRFWQYQPALPSVSGGAVWAPAGPAVDGAGYVYATTGNPDPPAGQTASVFDYSDSVVKLDPAKDFVESPATELVSPLGWFEPPNWEEESNNDLDLSSAAAELLPGGLLFQAGKDGVGYLINEATMDKGEASVYHSKVCGENSGYGGSFGGDAFANEVIYIPCENGTQALAFDAHAGTFMPLWQGPSNAVGPPIVSADLVWTVATGGFSGGGDTLYGLDPATGVPRYTETLPSPVVDHFASPSAAGGRLFLATGSSVTAYQIAQPSSAGSCASTVDATTAQCSPAGGPPGAGEASTNKQPGGTSTAGLSGSATTTPTKPPPSRAHVQLLRTHLHSSASGDVHVTLRCTPSPTPCQGTIALGARLTHTTTTKDHRHRHTISVELAHVRFGPTSGSFLLTLHLNRGALAHLRRQKNHLKVQVTVSSPGEAVEQVKAVLT
ncbi:MAG: PQQ-binding-like beta-propeller repeat protein [Solirubrobacteraceae bacterium]